MSAELYALIRRAYDIIGDATPLPVDCGVLCGDACCESDDEGEMGMLLFPGEAPRLARVPDFHITRISYMDAPVWHMTCDPPCERSLRPLACRMFPLAPKVHADGRVTARPDPRGRVMCPLADGTHLDIRFRRKITRAFQHLAQHPTMLAFLRRISDEVDELERFFR